MTIRLKQADKQVSERVNILEKQGNHKSKTYNRFTKTKKNKSTIQKKIIKSQKEKERDKEEIKHHGKIRFKIAINTYLSIVTLNVNGLNALIKRHRVADWT